jgi:hypothetical protein
VRQVGGSTQCFSIEDEGNASEASSRRVGWAHLRRVSGCQSRGSHRSGLNILGVEGGRFEREGRSLNRPKCDADGRRHEENASRAALSLKVLKDAVLRRARASLRHRTLTYHHKLQHPYQRNYISLYPLFFHIRMSYWRWKKIKKKIIILEYKSSFRRHPVCGFPNSEGSMAQR